jgi:DNA-binding CsgD family transcriptional regulator
MIEGADAERVEVPPLTEAEVESLASAVLGGPVDMGFSHALWRSSAGNALYLRELLQSARDGPALRVEEGVWVLVGDLETSPRLLELVEARLRDVDADERDALELLAVGEPLALRHFEAVVPAEVVARLRAGGLVAVPPTFGDPVVQLAHPVYGEALRESLPGLRARRLARRLADSLEGAGPESGLTGHDLDRIARWRVDSGAALAVEGLVRAAESALNRFDVAFAQRCARVAFTRSPDAESGLLLADALMLGKRHEEAEAVLAAVEGLVEGDAQVVHVAQTRSHNLFRWLDRYDDAVAVSVAAEGRVASEEGRRRISCHRASFDLLDGRPLAALAAVEHCLADDSVLLEATVTGGMACMMSGQFDRGTILSVAGGAVQRSLGGRGAVFDPSLPRITEVFILVHSGRLANAVTSASRAHAQAIDTGDSFARGWFAYLLGTAALLGGDVTAAQRWFQEALTAITQYGPDPRAHIPLTGSAHAAALAGDVAAAERFMEQLDSLPGRPWRWFDGEAVRARAWGRVAAGDLAAGVALLTDAVAVLEADGSYLFESAVLHDLVRLGRASHEVVDRLTELGDLVQGELTEARVAHGQAAIEGAHAALRDVSERFEDMGALLFAAETAAAGAAAARRHGQPAAATELSQRARALFDGCHGARTSERLAATVAAPLTEREREIATLAASGASSREIADRLGLSPRTVDNHLQRAFLKLEVSRRSELAQVLGVDGT